MGGQFQLQEYPKPNKPLVEKWQLWLLVLGESGGAYFGHHALFGLLVLASVILCPLVLARKASESLTLGLVKRDGNPQLV